MLRLGLDFPTLKSLASVVTASGVDKALKSPGLEPLAYVHLSAFRGEEHVWVEATASDRHVLVNMNYADLFDADITERMTALIPADLFPAALRSAKKLPAKLRRHGELIAYLTVDGDDARITTVFAEHPIDAASRIPADAEANFPNIVRLIPDTSKWGEDMPLGTKFNAIRASRAMTAVHPTDHGDEGDETWSVGMQEGKIEFSHRSNLLRCFIVPAYR